MRKIFVPMFIMAFAVMGVAVTPKEGSAVPSFSRQMNLPCFACHYQHIPKLNAFGREFKMGGYTATAATLIEDELLSLPAALPISFVAKYRYRVDTLKTASTPDKKGAERGQWDIYDEAALFVAGRAGDHIGYEVEMPSNVVNMKVYFTGHLGDYHFGVVPYRTDAAGPFWALDVANTGLHHASKSFEHKDETSAAAKMIWGSNGAATGLSFEMSSSMLFAGVSLWGPADGNPDTGLDLSNAYRLAVMPNLGGFDTLIGLFGVAGKTKCVNCGNVGPNATNTLQEFKTEAFGVDAQAQGEVGGLTLEVQAQYVTVGDSDSIYKKGDAISTMVELGFTKAVGVSAAYMTHNDKSGSKDVTDTATTLSVYWNIAQNLVLKPEYSIYTGDNRSLDNRLTVLMFMGF